MKKSEILKVETMYTGGNIYVFLGSLSDGKYFMAESSCFDVRILNADPSAVETDKYGDSPIWYSDWQEEHLVKDLTEKECPSFFIDMLNWVRFNSPNDYDFDLEHLMEEAKELEGTTGWR